MEIHDSKGEYVEIFIGILIASNLSSKVSEDNILEPIGIDYIDDNEPFEEIGKEY